MQKKLTASVALALLATVFGSAAFAQQQNHAQPNTVPVEAAAEAAAVGAVSVTLADAIASVEAMNSGKVVEAALVTADATSVYQITTLQPDGTETNYAVDAKSGAVVTTVDQQDEGDDNEGGYETRDDGDQGEANEGLTEGPNGDGDGETQDDVVN